MPANRQGKAAYDKLYREKNREKKRERDRLYRERNAERIRIQGAEYRQNNRDSLCARKRESHQKNKDKDNRRARAYQQCKKAELAVKQKEYRERVHDILRERKKRYYQENRATILARQKVRRELYAEDIRLQKQLDYQRHREKRQQTCALWRANNREKMRDISNRRRARLRQVSIGKIDYDAIKKRDRMLCCVCGKLVKQRELTFDHVLPLALGGAHQQQNLRVCHRRCNSCKHLGALPVQMILFDLPGEQ